MSSGGAMMKGFASGHGLARAGLTDAQKIAAKVFLTSSCGDATDAPIDEAYEVEVDDFARAECELEVAADAADHDAAPTAIVPMGSAGAATVVSALAASRKAQKFKAPRAYGGAASARKAAPRASKSRFKRPRSAPQGGRAEKASATESPTAAQLAHRTARAAIVPRAEACTAQVAASRTLLSEEQAALVAKKRAAALAKLAAKRSTREFASNIALAEVSGGGTNAVLSSPSGASSTAATSTSSSAPRTTASAFAATEFLATGIVGLDTHLGGGLPIGQLSEVHGASGCGKTQLFYTLAGAVTRVKGECAGQVMWIDCLKGYAAKRLEEIPGASLDAVQIAQVNTLARIRRLIKIDIPRLCASAAAAATPVPFRLVMVDGLVAAVRFVSRAVDVSTTYSGAACACPILHVCALDTTHGPPVCAEAKLSSTHFISHRFILYCTSSVHSFAFLRR